MEYENQNADKHDHFNDRNQMNTTRIHLVFDRNNEDICLVKTELIAVPRDLLDELLNAMSRQKEACSDNQATETCGELSKPNDTVTHGENDKREVKTIVAEARKRLGHAKFESMKEEAINGFLAMRKDILSRIENGGYWHYGITTAIEVYLPEGLPDRRTIAYTFVPETLDRAFGPGMTRTEPRPKVGRPGNTKWVVFQDAERNNHGGGSIRPRDRGSSNGYFRRLEEQE